MMADDRFEPEPQTVHDYLRELRRDVKEIKEQTIATNGRLGVVETWKAEIVSKQREGAAYTAGAATAFLTKRQVGGILAALSVAGSIVSAVTALIVRAAG